MDSEAIISHPLWWWILGWETFLVAMSFVTWRLIGINRLNTFSLFFPLVLLTNGILLPFSRNINSVISGLEIGDVAFGRFTIGVALFYLALPVGIILANSCWKTRIRFQLVENTCRWPNGSFMFLCAVIGLSGVYLAIIIRDGLFLNPFLLIRGFGSYENYALHRYNFAAATSGARYFLYNKLPYAIAPMAVIILWNWKKTNLLVRISGLVLISVVLTQTGHKLPLVVLLCTCLLSGYALKNNFSISPNLIAKGLGLFAAIVFVIIPFFYMGQGTGEYSEALWWSIERVFGESYRALQLYFYTYPDFHAHLGGASQQTIAALMGTENFLPTSIYIPTVILGISNTSYPALFISDAWADFGFMGIIFSSILCGGSLQIYNIWFFRKPKRSLDEAALLIAVSVSAVHMTYCNIITAFSTYGLGVYILIYFLIRRIDFRKNPAYEMSADIST